MSAINGDISFSGNDLSVIKLGGSLLETESLRACLEVVSRWPGRVAIVTGGGVFADQVRIQQQRWRFDDVAAHRMALLAMQQMALLCQSLMPAFCLFDSVAAFEDVKRVGIWMPDVLELDAAAIPNTWQVTSDSLAAWLAGRLAADRLVLVKAASVDEGAALPSLQARGVVDDAFLHFAEPERYRISVISQPHFLVMP